MVQFISGHPKKCFFGIAALGFQTQEGGKDLFLFFKVKILNEHDTTCKHCVTKKQMFLIFCNKIL